MKVNAPLKHTGTSLWRRLLTCLLCFIASEASAQNLVISHPGIGFTPAGSPTVTQAPQRAVLFEGESHRLEVLAHGNGQPLSYQWYKNDGSLNDLAVGLIPGATQSILDLSQVGFKDTGLYRVKVSNTVGFVYESAMVKVIKAGTGGSLWALEGGGARLSVNYGFFSYSAWEPEPFPIRWLSSYVSFVDISYGSQLAWSWVNVDAQGRESAVFSQASDLVFGSDEQRGFGSQYSIFPLAQSCAGIYRCKFTPGYFITFWLGDYTKTPRPPDRVVSVDFNLQVHPANRAPILHEPSPLPTGQVGMNYRAELHAIGTRHRIMATGLPRGLSLDPVSGDITGTPQQSGSFNVRYFAKNAFGNSEIATQVLTVRPLPAYLQGTFSAILQDVPHPGPIPAPPPGGISRSQSKIGIGKIDFTISLAGSVTARVQHLSSIAPYLIINHAHQGHYSLIGHIHQVSDSSSIIRLYSLDGSNYTELELFSDGRPLSFRTVLPSFLHFYQEGKLCKMAPRDRGVYNLLISPTRFRPGEINNSNVGYDMARLTVQASGSLIAVGRDSQSKPFSLSTIVDATGDIPWYLNSTTIRHDLNIIQRYDYRGVFGLLVLDELNYLSGNMGFILSEDQIFSSSSYQTRRAQGSLVPALLPRTLSAEVLYNNLYRDRSMTFDLNGRGLGTTRDANPSKVWITYRKTTGEFSWGHTDTVSGRRFTGQGLLIDVPSYGVFGGGCSLSAEHPIGVELY